MTPEQEFHLARLRALRDRGVITPRAFEEQRRALMGEPAEAAPGEPLRAGDEPFAQTPFVQEPAATPPGGELPPPPQEPEGEPGSPPEPSIEAVPAPSVPLPAEPLTFGVPPSAPPPASSVPAAPPPPPAWGGPPPEAPVLGTPPPPPPPPPAWGGTAPGSTLGAGGPEVEVNRDGVPVFASPASLAWTGEAPEPHAEIYERAPGSLEPYPMLFEVEYPEQVSRLSTAFRIFLILPVLVLFYPLTMLLYAGGAVGLVTVFLRRKYPGWLFAATAGALGFHARTFAYGALLTDKYPSFEPAGSPVRLAFARPPSGKLSRWRVYFWKATLLLPHLIVLGVLGMCVFVVTILAWFAILFTGRYPRGMFGFVTGVGRWHYRVGAYFLSFNDRFPPFALASAAGPASNATVVICGVIGGILATTIATGIGVAAYLDAGGKTQDVSYSDLVAGRANLQSHYSGPRENPDFSVRLRRAYDPGDDLVRIIEPAAGWRVVVFEWTVANTGASTVTLGSGSARLTYEDADGTHGTSPELMTAGDRVAPAGIAEGSQLRVRAAFLIPKGSAPVKLRFEPPWTSLGGITYSFN